MRKFSEKLEQDYLEGIRVKVNQSIQYELQTSGTTDVLRWSNYLSRLSENLFGNAKHYGLVNFFQENSGTPEEALRVAERNFDLGWQIRLEGKRFFVVSNEGKRVADCTLAEEEKATENSQLPVTELEFQGFLEPAELEKLTELLESNNYNPELVGNASFTLEVAKNFGNEEEKRIATVYRKLSLHLSALVPSEKESRLSFRDLLALGWKIDSLRNCLTLDGKSLFLADITGFPFGLNAARRKLLTGLVFIPPADSISNLEVSTAVFVPEIEGFQSNPEDFWSYANSKSRQQDKLKGNLAALVFTDILFLGRKNLDLGSLALESLSGRAYSYPVKGFLSHTTTELTLKNLTKTIGITNPYIHSDSVEFPDEISAFREFLPEQFLTALGSLDLGSFGLTAEQQSILTKNKASILRLP